MEESKEKWKVKEIGSRKRDNVRERKAKGKSIKVLRSEELRSVINVNKEMYDEVKTETDEK